jgi:hypothetical protein
MRNRIRRCAFFLLDKLMNYILKLRMLRRSYVGFAWLGGAAGSWGKLSELDFCSCFVPKKACHLAAR